MSDTLKIYGVTYTGVTSLNANDTNHANKKYVRPQGTKSITQNGTGIDVTEYASVDVSVSGGQPTLETQTKTYTPTESQQTETITPSVGYDGIGEVDVTVNAISSTYVGSGITRRSSSDLVVDGGDIITPAGYYANQAVGSVFYTTPGTPTATKTVDTYDSFAEIVPTVTNTTGYITGGTKTGTAVTVTASELVSGNTINVDDSGNWDVANCETAVVPQGVVTAPSTISSTGATVSTGTNTLTFSKTVSVTPNVTTDGYITNGTAGNSSVSLTASVTTKGATTYNTSSSDQTITSGTYLTGTQTIRGVTTTNLTAGNIKSGVVVQVGDSADSDRVLSVTGTYSGGGGSSMNVQIAQSTSRTTSTSYTSLCSLTCDTAGTYNVYWTGFRTSTSGTWGNQLYVGDSAYGSVQNTWSNHIQNVKLTGVVLTKNQTVAVYARSRGSNYYAYVSNLVIEQTA